MSHNLFVFVLPSLVCLQMSHLTVLVGQYRTEKCNLTVIGQIDQTISKKVCVNFFAGAQVRMWRNKDTAPLPNGK